MRRIVKLLNSDDCLKEATELLQVAFSIKNMGQKYKLYQEANDLKKIAQILFKYEEMIQRGDY